MSNRQDHWLTFENHDDYSRIRDVFARANYTPSEMLRLLGQTANAVVTDYPLLMRQTAGGSNLDTLIRIFLGGIAVSEVVAREALSPVPLETWAKAGLIQRQDGEVSSPFKIMPLDSFLFAYDQYRRGVKLKGDHVMGIGGSTLSMMKFMIPCRSKLALDLGTGSGALASFKSRSSDRVIATDRNPRAVRLTSFNVQLNGISNAECREGSLFEPVQDLKFDYIISNAPFVITPSSGYLYLDGGLRGDEFCQSLVRGAAEHLTENGYCQFLCNWAHFSNQDWKERLKGWFERTGCDVWVVGSDTRDVSSYATTWLDPMAEKGSPEFARLYNEWMDYYERERIEAVSLGFVTMRRRSSARNWFHFDAEAGKQFGEFGDTVQRFFGARDFLSTVESDAQFVKAVLQPAPGLRLDMRCEPSEGRWRPLSHLLRLEDGFRFEATTDPMGCEFISHCDGKRTVGEVLNHLAATFGMSPEKVTQAGSHLVRHFIERGFVIPAQLPGTSTSGSV